MSKLLTDAEALDLARSALGNFPQTDEGRIIDDLARFVTARLTPVKPKLTLTWRGTEARCECKLLLRERGRFCPGCGRPLDWGSR